MNPNKDHGDEQRLADLLALAGQEAVPPDPVFLDRLRRESAQVFAASPVVKRRPRMFALAMRAAAACVAAGIVIAVALLNGPGADSALAFEDVLAKTSGAETLHLKITRAGKTGEVFARRPQQARVKDPDGTYCVVRGSQMWRVDEKANRATPQTPPRVWDDKAGLDLLALLDLKLEKDRARLVGARPVGQVESRGRTCRLYRIEWPRQEGTMRLEALVDPATQFLHSLEAKTERDGRLEPLARLEVVSLNEPLAEELFVVGDTLTEDGRIGSVIDVQGIVSVKPVMAQRWTPVDRRMLVMPGDWLRTDLRGANAATVRLVPQTEVTLGPGTLVEMVSPRQLRISSGELKIAAPSKSPIELTGPDGKKLSVEGTRLCRVQQEKLVPLEQKPKWLLGYEGLSADESIGSLVATIDGRNVPLTVGFHKVTVDVRDQIARTVIEESFVNHTGSTLEGVFHFPLPQDASISGFGMWIGDTLVEADIVEKQRAREIYEEILREKRDPGLLEWTGGNIFKARVYPITPHSEKRVRISYTQVLPLRGSRYRYHYALQSELLKQHPLRELAIDVKVNSAVPLKSVACPTHAARTDRTAHAAHVEFTAQEYTPTRDFEVVVEIDGRQGDVVLIPHRRGDDGYFMLQLTPPARDGNWDRELMADGEPLELLILADTSASMDRPSRARQADMVAAILSSLGPKDRFNLAVCDVECRWAFQQAVPAEDKHVAAARELLAERVSLGWTDLDKAIASALAAVQPKLPSPAPGEGQGARAQSAPKTHVIYLGDGIVTTGDQDPVAFTKRVRRLYEGKAGTFHAVAVSSSFEPAVMRTIASLGGGSFRQITGERSAAAVAKELLAEIAQPGLRDLRVEFRGLRTARVYPDVLPNLPLGSQQIVLGRYLPEGRDQVGEVVVTGTQEGKPVRFSRPVSLKDAEQGNSFIPRLWARMHLDYLLQQGTSQSVIDDIIALSEQYNIITPYTSMLVLESDADRERFRVKTRFRMRDAEQFFAEGRANANFELVQQQMKRAGTWRIGMRRAVLQQLAGLGRSAELLAGRGYAGFAGSGGFRYRGDWNIQRAFSMGGFGGGSAGWDMMQDGLAPFGGATPDYADFYVGASLAGAGLRPKGGPVSRENGIELDLKDRSEEFSAEALSERFGGFSADLDVPVSYGGLPLGPEAAWPEGEAGAQPMDVAFAAEPMARTPVSPASRPLFARLAGDEISVMGAMASRSERFLGLAPAASISAPAWYFQGEPAGGQWLQTLFPSLAPPPKAPKEPKKPWPEPARQMARSLLRIEHLLGFQEGLQVERQQEYFDVRWGELTSRSSTLTLVSRTGWDHRSAGDASQTVISWCDGKTRGVLGTAFQLGRQRAAEPEDLQRPPLDLSAHVLEPLDRVYQAYVPELRPQADQRTLLVLRTPRDPRTEVHILIDARRRVILQIESRHEGRVTSATRLEDFVEVAGAWYAGRIETFDEKNRRTSRITQRLAPLPAGQWQTRWKQELAAADSVQLLREPLPRLLDAKRALVSGKATLEDHMVMALHFERSQQWARVLEHWEKAEKLAPGKPGLRWVRSALLESARRREELKARVLEEASRLAGAPAAAAAPGDQLFLANHLLNLAARYFEANESLALLDALKPVFARQPAHVAAMRSWMDRRAGYLQSTGQGDQALALRRQIAQQSPHDANAQQQYARALADAQDYEAAYAWIAKVLGPDARWLPYEEESLRSVTTDLMRQQGRYAELVDYLAGWTKRNPDNESPYRQYLGALGYADRVEEADAAAARWLAEGQTPEKITPGAATRLRVAVSHALGQGHNYHRNTMDRKWHQPLAEAVLFFARHDKQLDAARQIMGHHLFTGSDECRRVRKTTARILRDDLAGLSAEQIGAMIDWIWPNDPAVEPELWKQIAAGLRRRWAAEPDPQRKNALGASLARVLAAHAAPAEYLEFLRTQRETAPDEYRAQYVGQLFHALLAQPWSAEHENEAMAHLERLSDAEEPAQRLMTQVAALHKMTDRMVQARSDARMKTVEHPEKLPRTELAAKRAENLRLAREGFADRLQEEARRRQPPLSRWMTIERLYLDVLAGRGLAQAEGECWELLGPAPPKPAAEDDLAQALEELLRSRCLVTLANLAARKTARPASVDRLLAYLDKAIAADVEDIRYRLLKVQLLIALDRPQDLAQALEGWIKADDADSRWRQALAYLHAEQGQLEKAIGLFEAIREADGLGPTDDRALADWYMAVGRREDHRRAMIAAYKTVPEWQLNNWLSGKLNPWRRQDVTPPSQLDEEVLLAFAALFEKATSPQNHLYQLAEFYRATRDFRLLAGLADAVVGHTAGKVYPFLQSMDQVLREVHDEATADSLVERIARLRAESPRTKVEGRQPQPSPPAPHPASLVPHPSTIDQRALDLLEVLAERRAAELKNQPGPHGQRALAAMQRAFSRPWTPGEPRLVADLLASLGTIAYRPLADEQVRQLETLHQQAGAGSIDRLHIAHALARCYWSYVQRERAMDLLESGLSEHQAAMGGTLPAAANSAIDTLIGFTEGARHFARGEKYLQEQLQHPVHQRQVFWLAERLYQLYEAAIREGGDAFETA